MTTGKFTQVFTLQDKDAEIAKLQAEIQSLKSFDPMSDHDAACPCCGYKFGDLMQRNADLQAENQRLRDESDEWERKSKNNGLAAMIGLERLQMLEPKIYQLQDDNARLRAALEVYATPKNWENFCIQYGIKWVDPPPWIVAQEALGQDRP